MTGPVFLDRRGTRRRWFTLLGAGLGAVLVVAMVALVVGLFGVGPGQLPALPGGHEDDGQNAPAAGTPRTPPTTPAPRPAPPRPATSPTAPPGQAGATTTPGRRNQPSHTPPHPGPKKT